MPSLPLASSLPEGFGCPTDFSRHDHLSSDDGSAQRWRQPAGSSRWGVEDRYAAVDLEKSHRIEQL
ncbi:MAG TPA: hypothetical protein VI074_00790 [Propionibacteriaceae bacterium]